ncbi:Eco57I restriction-modification methylase domain-containing protein [Candidatus Spongiihabitans sp.]|uniref:Eco57I restriction-modification methylase domain-containing protein n=1 Tax=Candidatus Spongiihabitans sp. TaxID=3101308 RepID=UPI003C6EE7B2
MHNLTCLEQLITTFDRNREAYLSGKFNETQVRVEFINPLFELLGWDVHNKRGYAESYKDVYHEDAVLIEGANKGATKAPDYAFRIGGTRKFFLEAKKPSVNIKGDPGPAFQLRRYGWSAKLPLSILTDFEEFAVYDCRVKPVKNDNASKARTLYFTYNQYLDKWDEIHAVFSREAVLKGSFDKYADSYKTKRGTAQVDDAFLAEIEGWRGNLARNLALRNPALTQRELNFSVLRIIDRIIFLRMCEDREIEPYGQLQNLLDGTGIYSRLTRYFKNADDKYNSGLFHFNNEKGRPTQADELTLQLKIDDKVLKDILKTVYYPQSPYEFSVFPSETLGQVYEQFLGKVITLTPKHQARIIEKPEVKKAGGVYYTPKYIVDYIVGQTVGKLLAGKRPAAPAVKNLKVLDPACGSGSFLLGAYQYILAWYCDQYVKAGVDQHKKVIYQTQGGEWRLTTAERKRILLQHIHGVDIDIQAVETSKLSLLLQVLEGESSETLKRQLSLLKERALPDLGDNIKCGNALIAADFYDNQQTGLFDEAEQYRINIFDWRAEFPDIMQAGGFDAVIGNPPYVRQETLGRDKAYFQKKFKVYHGMADLYAYFIEQGITLTKQGGYFSYIVSNKWMRANYGKGLRLYLQQQCIEEIVDFGDLPVFKTATAYPCILGVSKNAPKNTLNITEVKTLAFQDLSDYVLQKHHAIDRKSLSKQGWHLANKKTQSLLVKLKTQGTPLRDYVNGKIYYGIKTGFNKAFVIDAQTRNRLIKEDANSKELIKPFLGGRDIKRYQCLSNDKFLIFARRGINIKNYPTVEKYLQQFRKQLTPKPKNWSGRKWEGRASGGYKWYELQSAVDYYAEFEKPKIIIPAIVQKASYAFDKDGFFSNDKTSIISADAPYLLGLLNSKISDFVLHSIASTKRGGYFEYKPMYVAQLPIRKIDFSNPEEKTRHNQMVALVEQIQELNKKLAATKTAHEKTVLQRQIDATDRQIDQRVYELYDLTKAEIKIIEDSVN